jgi:hypothetical protein
VGFDEMQAERHTEALPKQEGTALAQLEQMVDAMHTSGPNTLPLAAQQPVPSSSWGDAPHAPKPLDLGGHGNWNSAQLVSSGQLATGSDTDLSSGIQASDERSTADPTRHFSDDRAKTRLRHALIVVSVVAIVLLLIVVALQWPLWLSGFFRHY